MVLAGILAGSGLGALASSRLKCISRPLISAVFAAVITLLIVDKIGIPWIVRHAIGLKRSYRIAITLLILAPNACALGHPFRWASDGSRSRRRF